MNDRNYEGDEPEEDSEEQESASLEGKGWDILAGGKDNPFAMGGDDPFDLKSLEDPNPYTDDDEANWIIGTGPGQPPPEAAPPITAPDYLFPEGQTPADMGLSPGVRVTPIGPEGEPPIMPPPADLPPISPPPFEPAYPAGMPGVESVYPMGGEMPSESADPGLSPGVSVTPITGEGQPPYVPEHTHSPEEAIPIPPAFGEPTLPPGFDSPLGGPMIPTAGGPVIPPMGSPSIPSSPAPAVPDEPPWELPRPQSTPRGDLFISDPFPTTSAPPRIRSLYPDELDPDEGLRSLLITTDRVNALWEEINETYNLIIDDVRGHYETTEQAILDLKRARELLLAGPKYYDNAEQLVVEVKARLRLAEKVRQWSRTRGTWLAAYLIIWLLLLSAASFLTQRVEIISAEFGIPDSLAGTWLPSLFGGLGGVIGALWILVKHIAVKRDFDPIHSPWYIINPFLGVAMGVVTYFVVLGGGEVLRSQVLTEGAQKSNFLMLLLCIVVGFNQNVLWSLIDRIVDTIFPRPQEDEATITGIGPDHTTIIQPKDQVGPQG